MDVFHQKFMKSATTLDDDVPRSTSYGVNKSQLIRFARVSNYVTAFMARNKILTTRLL